MHWSWPSLISFQPTLAGLKHGTFSLKYKRFNSLYYSYVEATQCLSPKKTWWEPELVILGGLYFNCPSTPLSPTPHSQFWLVAWLNGICWPAPDACWDHLNTCADFYLLPDTFWSSLVGLLMLTQNTLFSGLIVLFLCCYCCNWSSGSLEFVYMDLHWSGPTGTPPLLRILFTRVLGGTTMKYTQPW